MKKEGDWGGDVEVMAGREKGRRLFVVLVGGGAGGW